MLSMMMMRDRSFAICKDDDLDREDLIEEDDISIATPPARPLHQLQ